MACMPKEGGGGGVVGIRPVVHSAIAVDRVEDNVGCLQATFVSPLCREGFFSKPRKGDSGHRLKCLPYFCTLSYATRAFVSFC